MAKPRCLACKFEPVAKITVGTERPMVTRHCEEHARAGIQWLLDHGIAFKVEAVK